MTVSTIADLRVALARRSEPASALARVADIAEQRLSEIADRVTAEVAAQVPDYVVFPGTVNENRWIIGMIVSALRAGEPCGVKEGELIRQRAHRWAQDAPLDMVATAFHVGLRSLVRILGEMTQLDEPATVALQDAAWAFALLSSNVLAEVQRDLGAAAAQSDHVRRAEFLRDMASGQVTTARLACEAAAYGVDSEHEYLAVRAQGSSGELTALAALLDRAASTRALRVVSLVEDGHLIALAPRRPRMATGTTVAMGEPRRLSEIHASFSEAADVLAVACAFGLTGPVDLVAIGPLALATVGDHLAQRLARHYLSGRDAAFVEIAETVRTLLDNDLGIDQTATQMHLHRNTVRYRVQRFRELTGLDVRHTSDLVTIWWLLKWRSLHSE